MKQEIKDSQNKRQWNSTAVVLSRYDDVSVLDNLRNEQIDIPQ
jgi:hypothetical protein